MSRLEKEIERLLLRPKDYTYDEAKSLLNKLGFYEDNKGRTSGSRVRFLNKKNVKINLHRPHPKKILKPYQIEDLIEILEKGGVI